MADYSDAYAALLYNGARANGNTDIEFCLEHSILYSEYKEWVKNIPEFTKAHEFGEMQAAAYWHKLARNLAEKGNASVLVAGMKNLAVANWVDKKEVVAGEAEPIRAIEITILPPRDLDENSENRSD